MFDIVTYIFFTNLKNDFPFKSNQYVLLYIKQWGIRILKTLVAFIRTAVRNFLFNLEGIDRQGVGGILGAVQGPGAIVAVSGGLAMGPLNGPLTELVNSILGKSIKS